MPEPIPSLAAEIERLSQHFRAAGGVDLTFEALQPAEVFLDLYGEDIRNRAFTTRDGLSELMLRPDFTVPVAAHHIASGSRAARYTYTGPVWRKFSAGKRSLRETHQVGFELFGAENAAKADAEVFSIFSEAVSNYALSVSTGDIGILLAALNAIDLQPARRAALLRHMWRPERFRALLQSYANPKELSESRRELLAALGAGELLAKLGSEQEIGLRERADIEARIARLAEEATAEPLSRDLVGLLDSVVDLRGTSASVLSSLQDLLTNLPKLRHAIDVFEARLDALQKRGIDAANLPFEASFGRTSLEYYDGFVFGFFAEDRADLPVMASGGRYDALTAQLGQGNTIPAVGGVVRPEALLALQAGGA